MTWRCDLLQAPKRAARKFHARFASGEIDHTHVLPKHATAQSGSQRLGTSLLRGKAFGVRRGTLRPPVGLLAFDGRENAPEKTLPETFDAFVDAADVDEI